jgi:peptide/nickel transport system permease protein
LLNPGYKLWVWGEEIEPGVFLADKIQAKPPTTASPPDDVNRIANVISITGTDIKVEDLNSNKFTVRVQSGTEFSFPAGEARPRPEAGTWLDISWLTGAEGLLGRLAGFNGPTRGILRMDFGFSWKLSPGQPVIDIIRSRLSNTIILMSTATLFSLLIAIPIGIYSAVHQYSRLDYAVTTFAFFGSAMPVFWFGLMMILIFSLYFKQWDLPFLPSGGTQLVRTPQPGSLLDLLGATPGSLVDRLVHILMPATVLSLLYMAGWSRFMRTSMLEVLRQDYVRTARAKGLLERVVIIKHAARNALIPLITIIVFQLPGIFGGAILTETIFSYPGMGRLYFDALGGNDWPIVMVILFISAVLVVVATLIRDVLYTIVDPRIKFT